MPYCNQSLRLAGKRSLVALFLMTAACGSDGHSWSIGGPGTAGGSTGGTGSTGGGGSVATTTGTVERAAGTTASTGGGLLVTAGNAVLSASSAVDGVGGGTPASGVTSAVAAATGQVGQTVKSLGTGLGKDGAGGLPLAGPLLNQVIGGGDQAANPLAKVLVTDQMPVGSSNPNSQQMLGLSALAPAGASGQIATVGVLSGGNALTVNLPASPGAITGALTGSASSAVGGAQTATAPVSGGTLTPIVAPATGGPAGGLIAPVTNIVSGLTAASPATGPATGGITGLAGGLLGK